MDRFQHFLLVALLAQLASFPEARFLARKDPGELADAEVEKMQLEEQLDADKTAAQDSDKGEEHTDDTSEGEFDREEAALWNAEEVGEDADDDESFLQEKTKEPTEEDPGDLADAEVEKIQVAEQLDSDKTAATTDSDTEGATEEEFDADDEARRSEMYEEPDADADAALVQKKKKAAAAALIQKKDDPDDLADAEVEKIQIAEQLDEDKTAPVHTDGEEDNEEEFDADNEARRSEMYEDYEDDDGSTLIQQRKKAQKGRSLAKRSSLVQKAQRSKQPNDIADAAAEKIQVREDMDMTAAEKKDMEAAETDAAVQTYDTESSDDAFEANFASSS